MSANGDIDLQGLNNQRERTGKETISILQTIKAAGDAHEAGGGTACAEAMLGGQISAGRIRFLSNLCRINTSTTLVRSPLAVQ
jgi:hypothetical protein